MVKHLYCQFFSLWRWLWCSNLRLETLCQYQERRRFRCLLLSSSWYSASVSGAKRDASGQVIVALRQVLCQHLFPFALRPDLNFALPSPLLCSFRSLSSAWEDSTVFVLSAFPSLSSQLRCSCVCPSLITLLSSHTTVSSSHLDRFLRSTSCFCSWSMPVDRLSGFCCQLRRRLRWLVWWHRGL